MRTKRCTNLWGWRYTFSKQLDILSDWQNNSSKGYFFSVAFELPGHGFWPDSQHQASISFCGRGLKANQKVIGYPTASMPLLHMWGQTNLEGFQLGKTVTFLPKRLEYHLLVLWKLCSIEDLQSQYQLYVMGVWTQVLMLEWQVLYQLSHLPSHHWIALFFFVLEILQLYSY